MRTNLLIAMILCAFTIGSSMAQSIDTLVLATQAQKSEAIALRMQHELNLTNTQFKQIVKLMKDRFASLGVGIKPVDDVNQKSKSMLASVLTSEQFLLYEYLRKESAKAKLKFFQENPNYTFSKEDAELDF